MSDSGHTLWGGRFEGGLAPEMEALNRCLDIDWRLWRHDVRGSRAWARALGKAGILSPDEATRIDLGLEGVAALLEELSGPSDLPDEDIHSVVERLLTESIGPVGGKLHTGRSRNDQAATGFRLWGREAIRELDAGVRGMIHALVRKADEVGQVVMPAYTHLQQAQPVPAAHWLLSRAWPLSRDLNGLHWALGACDEMPLGSGAIAGCPFPVDRDALAAELGFGRISANSVDAVSDRDWVARLLFVCAMVGVHLSQLAEDFVVFSSREFGLLSLEGGFTTGSSLMPQKRNPDVAELTRGKSGRLVGNLIAILTVLKGLPTGYNRDLQEDKEAVFDSVDTLGLVLPAMTGAVDGLRLDEGRIAETLGPELLATDLADYLVRRGVPFREAHHAVGELVRIAEDSGRTLGELDPAEMKGVHAAFEADVAEVFSFEKSVASRSVPGGTAAAAVQAQREALLATLEG